MSPSLNSQVVPITEVPDDDVVVVDKAMPLPVVLVVDDEPLVADTLCMILPQAGYAAVPAYDGETALELASDLMPELLISDVAMPVMNGVELALALVTSRPACRVLLFSGHARSADLVNALDAGYDFPLLPKPMHPTEMLRQVSRMLRITERQRHGRMAEVAPIRRTLECA
jgi:DNA-binding response OmpR family regulator